MHYLPKKFFQLQILFAYKISQTHQISFTDSLFRYTTIYARLFGLPSTQPANIVEKTWGTFTQNLPTEIDPLVDLVYKAYVSYENKKHTLPSVEKIGKAVGCFSYLYLETDNIFDLHFANVDPLGNLGEDRMLQRNAELETLTKSIFELHTENAQVRMTSWLLSIDAFTRLMPPTFLESNTLADTDVAQENAMWGQFLNKEWEVKGDMADTLLNNTNKIRKSIGEYFPLQLKIATCPQEIFFEYYLK